MRNRALAPGPQDGRGRARECSGTDEVAGSSGSCVIVSIDKGSGSIETKSKRLTAEDTTTIVGCFVALRMMVKEAGRQYWFGTLLSRLDRIAVTHR